MTSEVIERRLRPVYGQLNVPHISPDNKAFNSHTYYFDRAGNNTQSSFKSVTFLFPRFQCFDQVMHKRVF